MWTPFTLTQIRRETQLAHVGLYIGSVLERKEGNTAISVGMTLKIQM